jgi:hypothetical protein
MKERIVVESCSAASQSLNFNFDDQFPRSIKSFRFVIAFGPSFIAVFIVMWFEGGESFVIYELAIFFASACIFSRN